MASKKTIIIVFPGEPITKSNAGFFGRGRFYTGSKSRKYEAALKKFVQEEVAKAGDHLFKSCWVALRLKYYVGSKRIKDLPNLPKTTCDALEDALYENDFQIRRMEMERLLDRDDPRVEIVIRESKDPNWIYGKNPKKKTKKGKR